mmetsp:Transcript_13583/g.47188  ORF Transcript_13583/g.47188 Transcript_13583/m.47188 type:complete len:338 (+) Transcript_13583:2411-3424(+)
MGATDPSPLLSSPTNRVFAITSDECVRMVRWFQFAGCAGPPARRRAQSLTWGCATIAGCPKERTAPWTSAASTPPSLPPTSATPRVSLPQGRRGMQHVRDVTGSCGLTCPGTPRRVEECSWTSVASVGATALPVRVAMAFQTRARCMISAGSAEEPTASVRAATGRPREIRPSSTTVGSVVEISSEPASLTPARFKGATQRPSFPGRSASRAAMELRTPARLTTNVGSVEPLTASACCATAPTQRQGPAFRSTRGPMSPNATSARMWTSAGGVEETAQTVRGAMAFLSREKFQTSVEFAMGRERAAWAAMESRTQARCWTPAASATETMTRTLAGCA